MFAPSRGRQLGHAIVSSPVTLPGFLVPAWQAATPRTTAAAAAFSTTSKRPSKLGRTPLSIPPGVELTVGEPFARKDLTTYKRVFNKTINIKGPLGALSITRFWGGKIWIWRLRVC